MELTRQATLCSLMAFLGKHFIFIMCHSQSATLPVHLFVSLFVNLHFLPYYFSALNIFQGFSLNFAKTLGRTTLMFDLSQKFSLNFDITKHFMLFQQKNET